MTPINPSRSTAPKLRRSEGWRSPWPSVPSWAILLIALVTACGGAQEVDDTTPVATTEETSAQESTVEAAAEEAGPSDAGPDAHIGPCLRPAASAAAQGQLASFSRWLRDQAVGRHIAVEAVTAVCGDRSGFFIVHLTLRGASGELLSLGRALSAYYPGSSWTALSHERLGGPGINLRLCSEVLVPVDAAPRPRCTWDPAVDC